MKFYYKGQLMRTSKNHHYTHAVIRHNEDGTITCMGCSSSEQGAEKIMQGLGAFINYKIWQSVQNGTYKPKDRWSYSLERMRKEVPKEYESIDAVVEHYRHIISKYEIVKVEEA